jgi:hypothetical protein
MIWYKFTTPTGSYFSPFTRSKTYLKSYDNSHDLAEDMNKEDLNYNIQSSTLVEIYDKTTPECSPIDLPFGVYSYDAASNINPERLTPMITREDKYIDLLDEDKPVAGQKFSCISFVSPENVIKQREMFYMEEFIKGWDLSKSMEKFHQFLNFDVLLQKTLPHREGKG